MFVEFTTKQGKHISYNTNVILFIGERQRKTSIVFQDATFHEASEDYEDVCDKIEKAKKFILPVKESFIEMKTRKDERVFCYISRFFSILETDYGVSVVYIDGVEQEYPVNYKRFMKSIRCRLIDNCNS